MAQVNFPSNPQTAAECEGPAAEMRAMRDRELELVGQALKERDKIPHRGSWWEHPEYIRLSELHGIHNNEHSRIVAELRRLESACRAAAAQNETSSAATLNAFRELKDSYDEAKRAYDKAKELYLTPPAELAEGAVNRAADRLADETVASAYTRRNNAYSSALENVLNDAKRKILDLVPKSRIVAAFQDTAFGQLKLQAQQLLGDWNQLESDIRSKQASLSRPVEPSADAPPMLLSRERGTSGAAVFRQAVDQMEQDERERPMREARERARLAKAAEDEARVRQENLARLERARLQPAPKPSPAVRLPSSTGGPTCERELQQTNGRITFVFGGTGPNIPSVMEDIRLRIINRYDFGTHCFDSQQARCGAMPRGITSSSPQYGDALRLTADIFKARFDHQLRTYNNAMPEWALFACVALQMAAQIR